MLLGSPEYEITAGSIRFRGDDITDWSAEVRGKAGLFLAFQYPQEFPGVSVLNFLRQAVLAPARARRSRSSTCARRCCGGWTAWAWTRRSPTATSTKGFSGGEKKRNEILQMALLEPEMAILDETDSGLDIDALKIVATGVQEVRKDRSEIGVLAITHYQRLLDHLQPDHVHILIDGARSSSRAASSWWSASNATATTSWRPAR